MSNPPPGYGGPPPSPYTAPPAKSSGTPIVILLVISGVVLVTVVAIFFFVLVCGGGMAALLLPAVSSARDAARRMEHKNHLKELGFSYLTYWDSQGRDAAPQSWEDLRDAGYLDEEIASKLQESGTIVVWGVKQSAVDNSRLPRREIILAYPRGPSPADEPVAVLMADGSVLDVPFVEIQRHLSAWQAEQTPP